MVGLHAGMDADPVVGVVLLSGDGNPGLAQRLHQLGASRSKPLVEDVELRVGQHLAAGVEPHGAEEPGIVEGGADPVAVRDLRHRGRGFVVDPDDVVQLLRGVAEPGAHRLQRRLGERAVRVAPGREAVVELVDRGVEEVGGDLRRAVGHDRERLVGVAEQLRAGGDLAREIGEPGTERGVELDVAPDDGQQRSRRRRARHRLPQRFRSPVRGENGLEVLPGELEHGRLPGRRTMVPPPPPP